MDYETLGRTLTDVNIISGRYLTSPIDFSPIKNKKITSIKNKGKFIFWEFEDNTVLFNTLGMSGGWSKLQQTHSRVQFTLDNSLNLWYNDVRSFGTLKVANKDELRSKLKEIGPDMLNAPCSYIEFEKIFRKFNHKQVGPFLLEQKRISGVGNIYKCEALYTARIAPTRLISSLSDSELLGLYDSIINVLSLALKMRGSSQKDFKDVDGVFGTFLGDHAQVYRRVMDRNGNKVESLTMNDKRTTWWCPNVQK